jgi:2-polyprenyl-3-methyl-5-hydroxy-6-metoxy-1,4-benzoquinol methylase
MKNQTAVEWLVEELNQKIDFIPMEKWDMIRNIVQQAKAMEKQQIIDIDYRLSVIEDYAKGEAGDEITNLRKYINETYGK